VEQQLCVHAPHANPKPHKETLRLERLVQWRALGHPQKSFVAAVAALTALAAAPRRAQAQEPPPPIPRVAVDLHATVPRFPANQTLALSSGLDALNPLPGSGLGADIAVNVYPIKWKAVTFGLGGHVMTSRAHRTPGASADPTVVLQASTERFTYLGPQLSFNFGTGSGWSYLSAGIAASTWSIVPDGVNPLPPDNERLKTIDYGGGGRWFIKTHIAFSFDVRLYAINPGAPHGGLPGSPRTTLLVIGAGISLK
jgi:hypothetical protein